jgi:hypothetical protein
MIFMPRSSSLSSKKGERRYPKTSTVKFFVILQLEAVCPGAK